MGRNKLITAIDLGTAKTVVLAAQLPNNPEEKLEVVGIAVVPSQGIKKSQIIDLEEVVNTLNKALDATERMAGAPINSAFLNIAGGEINSLNSKGVVAVASPSQEIVGEDVDRVIEAAKAVSIPPGKEIIHIIPKDFSVDNQHGIKDPLGMTGIRLEAQSHIITANSATLKNFSKALSDADLKVDGFIFAGLAAAESVLTETEKELGVVVVDLGEGSTSICAYVEGSISYSSTLPIGARHITQDLALGCRISLEAAEKIKLELSKHPPGTVSPKPGENKDSIRKRYKKENELNLKELGIDEGIEKISKKTVIEGIMVPRMKEVFKLIEKELIDKKLIDQIPAGLVLTGGGAETIAIGEIAKRTFHLPVRIGQPKAISGLTHDVRGPEFAAVLGALEHAYKKGDFTEHKTDLKLSLPSLPKLKFSAAGKKIIQLVKSLLP